MATSTIKATMIRKNKTYSSLTVPSSNYVYIDSFSNLGVDASEYDLVSANIVGWSGSGPRSIIRGSNGTDFYLMGNTGTITSLGVEYVFSRK